MPIRGGGGPASRGGGARAPVPVAGPFGRFTPGARRLLAASAVASLGGGILGVVLNLHLRAAGFDDALIGTYTGLNGLIAGASALPAGMLADRLGLRKVLLGGSVVATLAIAGLALARQQVPLLVLAWAAAAGGAGMGVAVGPYLMESGAPGERDRLFGLQAGLTSGFATAGTLLGGLLPGLGGGSDHGGYRAAIAASAAVHAVVIFLLLALEPVPAAAASVPARRRVSLAALPPGRRAVLLRVLVPGVLIGFGAGMTIPYLNLYFKEQLHLSTAAIGAVFAAGGLLSTIGFFLSPFIAERLGKVRGIFFFQMASVPLLVLIGFGGPWVAVPAYLVRGTLMNMMNPILSSFNLGFFDAEERGRFQGQWNLWWNLAWAAGALMWGGLRRAGPWAPFVATAVCYVTALGLFRAFFIDLDGVGAAADGARA